MCIFEIIFYQTVRYLKGSFLPFSNRLVVEQWTRSLRYKARTNSTRCPHVPICCSLATTSKPFLLMLYARVYTPRAMLNPSFCFPSRCARPQVVANYYGRTGKLVDVPGKSIHWAGGRTSPPPDTPPCGFDGSLCPDNSECIYWRTYSLMRWWL